MRGFSINLKGRVKNFPLPKNQPLVPLFEAIVNSFHAIEERKRDDADFCKGNIKIEIIRENDLPFDSILSPIESFYITDNGVGFNEPNFQSFMESDSTYKAEFGGKGVGRFSWLAAYEKAEISSIYQEDGVFVKRSFVFSVGDTEIDDSLEKVDAAKENATKIDLVNCRIPYIDFIPKQANTIALRIIQHCLVYFMVDDCPKVELIDGSERYNLNKIFHNTIKTNNSIVKININGKSFDLLHVKAEEASINGNKLFLCANNRLVETKDLDKYITDLDRKIYDKCGFWYIGVLTGDYLDDNVDMNRLSFNIPDGGIADSLINTVSFDQIMATVTVEVEKYLADYLAPITVNKYKRIREYVVNEAPQFRHLLKYMADDISAIKPNLNDEKLDDELHKIKRRFDKEMKCQNTQLIKDLNNGSDLIPKNFVNRNVSHDMVK